MFKHKNKREIGYFLKRNDISNIKIKELLQELQILLLEAKIIKDSIHQLQTKQLSFFDAAVGDWKCQTRASMILDIMQDVTFLNQELSQSLSITHTLIITIKQLHDQIKLYNPTEQQALTKKLQQISLYEYFTQHELIYNFSEKLILSCLCFFNTLKNYKLPTFTNHQVSTNKIQKLFKLSKKTLCILSINHEQHLAKTYCSLNEQKVLTQIESHNFCSMTPTFHGAKAIFKKMKIKQQQFITNTAIFCACSGIISININFFISKNNEFIETSPIPNVNDVVMVINSYQFPGSLKELQKNLGVPQTEPFIPKQYYKFCMCNYPTVKSKPFTIENAILTFFAQHPQFLNDAPMAFEKLGLKDSDVHKEYNYLQRAKGFNRNDMSSFHIDHIYVSTIAEMLEQNEHVISSKTLVHSSPIMTSNLANLSSK